MITIRLAYNGDYPGYPCAWVNGRPVCDHKEEAFLLRMFGAESLKALFEKLGDRRVGDGAEHEPIEFQLEVKR